VDTSKILYNPHPVDAGFFMPALQIRGKYGLCAFSIGLLLHYTSKKK